MAIVETDGLVLRSYDLKDADKIVVLLTREHGVVRGVAKGAKRLQSKFGSALEPFSQVKITYFQKESQELVRIDRADLVRSSFQQGSSLGFLQSFSYMGDTLLALFQPHDPNLQLYRLLLACLEAGGRDRASFDGLVIYFNFWLLKLGGYWPDWARCSRCNRVIGDHESAAVSADFHLVCTGCGHAFRSFVRPEARALISTARHSSPAEFLAATLTQNSDLAMLTDLLHRMVQHAAGKEVKGLKTLTPV
jgi:DNA repair protein RecO (recombination protein O)